MDLKGKVTLVTGAGDGIGESIAVRLHAGGALVALVSRRMDPVAAICRRIDPKEERAFPKSWIPARKSPTGWRALIP